MKYISSVLALLFAADSFAHNSVVPHGHSLDIAPALAALAIIVAAAACFVLLLKSKKLGARYLFTKKDKKETKY